jgi:hypothetical protein
MSATAYRRIGLVGLGVLVALLAGGCPAWLAPEIELAGTWELTTANDIGAGPFYITFDDYGRVRWIAVFVNNQLSAYEIFPNTTSVLGDQVAVDAIFSGNELHFAGTFNASRNLATGTVTIQLTVGSVQANATDATATLRRLVSQGP